MPGSGLIVPVQYELENFYRELTKDSAQQEAVLKNQLAELIRGREKISWYKENDFGGYKSCHVFGKYTEFSGSYWQTMIWEQPNFIAANAVITGWALQKLGQPPPAAIQLSSPATTAGSTAEPGANERILKVLHTL